MKITRDNIGTIIHKYFEAERTDQGGTWNTESIRSKDIDDALHFYRNSFARGMMEWPKKKTPRVPYPFNGKFYLGWYLKEYLPSLWTARKREVLFRTHYDLLTAAGVRFPDFDPEHEDLRYNFDGKAFNAEVRKYATFVDILAKYGTRAKTVCDIGAGYGGMCEMMAINQPFEKYVIIDLFETLCISMSFLSHCPTVGDYKLIFVDSAEDLKNLPEKCILFVRYRTYQKIQKDIQRLPIELFINSNSFVEMGSKIIQQYFDFIESFKNVYLFSSNALHRVERGETMSAYELPYDKNWHHLFEVEVNAFELGSLSRLSYRRDARG